MFGKQCLALLKYLADPGKARGCSTNTPVIHSFIQSVILTALRRRHAQTVRYRASSYKIDYVIVIKSFLNPEGHQNPISGSKVTAILLKVWIWPIGEASAGRVCNQRGYPVSSSFVREKKWSQGQANILQRIIFLFNRPCVAGAVLQTPLLLID